jgi:5'-nucleotidase
MDWKRFVATPGDNTLPLKQNLRILISNDDGVDATGLKILHKIALALTKDVWIVAPESDQSGAAHSLTLKQPLKARRISARKFSVNGTPTDCVLVGVEKLIRGRKPDLVLSGVNRGSNIAEDITYSGTVAAAMEATLMGIPAIALSLKHTAGQPMKWGTALDHGAEVIRKLISFEWPSGVLMNVNFPDVASKAVRGIKIVKQGKRPPFQSLIERMDPRNVPYYWVGPIPQSDPTDRESDLHAIHTHSISVTPLHLDLTHYETMKPLQDAFKDSLFFPA